MSKTVLEGCLPGLEMSRRALLGIAEQIPAESRAHQAVPDANHVLWVLGHLATTDDFFLSKLSGQAQKFDEAWLGKFWMKSKPTGSASDYPSFDKLVDAANERRAALVTYLRSLSDEQLAAAMPEGLETFAPRVASLPASLTFHEGMHIGQVTIQRRALGLGPLMG